MSVNLRAALLGAAVAGVLAVPAGAAAKDPAADEAAVRRLAAAIDRHLEADWAARGIQPAPRADDAEFLRRVYLDLVGRLPKVSEVRAFLADQDPDKRSKLVNKLLTTPDHAAHFAAVTRAEWLPQAFNDFRLGFNAPQLERWLRDRYRDNTPADAVVRRLLTVKVVAGPRGILRTPADDQDDPDGQLLAAFYQANEIKPEQLGSVVSRLFLGTKLECAQCHDHPFAPISRQQFWEFAAFFGEFTPLPPVPPSFVGPLTPQYEKNRITIPNTDKTVVARYSDGTPPDWSDDRSPREELARWLTAAENPYFARNLANRMWAKFFGVGLIDPVDEPGDNNPPSHPELLDELARSFAAGGFDNRLLIRAITRSQAYHLTSRLTHPTQADPRRFARMNMKALSGSQIYDSFLTATGARDQNPQRENFFDFGNQFPRSQFQTAFPTANKPTEAQTSILQALMLMNGRLAADQTSIGKSEVLAAVLDAPFMDTGKRVEVLFLAALTRRPTDEELERYASYVDRGGPSGDKKKALADVFWVLLNSTEFLFNH